MENWATSSGGQKPISCGDGIYELRVGLQNVNYRILYFFHGRIAAIVSHGLVKEAEVPSKEIERAIERKRNFEKNPKAYTYEEE